MNKIIILVGENISDLVLQCGGSKEQGLFVEEYGTVKWIHHMDSTSRKCPENNKHPKIYQKWLVSDINYVISHWSYIVSTNSMHTINIVSDLIRNDTIKSQQVEIYGLSDDNKEILFKTGLDSEGYLGEDWHIGFLNIE